MCTMISPEYIWTPAFADAAIPNANRVAAIIRLKTMVGSSFRVAVDADVGGGAFG
jgi:hypothetical protein